MKQVLNKWGTIPSLVSLLHLFSWSGIVLRNCDSWLKAIIQRAPAVGLTQLSLKKDPSFQPTKPRYRLKNSDVVVSGIFDMTLKKCWFSVWKSSRDMSTASVSANAPSYSACWGATVSVPACRQQREAGSNAAAVSLAVYSWWSCDVIWSKNHLFVSFHDAWWVRISVTTQYNNINVII